MASYRIPDPPLHVRTAGKPDCPRCHGSVYRVPRRWLDFCTSWFRPVRRYCCRSLGCGWEGTMRAGASDAGGSGVRRNYLL